MCPVGKDEFLMLPTRKQGFCQKKATTIALFKFTAVQFYFLFHVCAFFPTKLEASLGRWLYLLIFSSPVHLAPDTIEFADGVHAKRKNNKLSTSTIFHLGKTSLTST